MALLKIARMGHPVLLQAAEPVADPSDPAIRRLVADMIETMLDAEGVGLAAPQVHVPLRLFVLHVPAGRDPDALAPRALINPSWEPVDGEEVLRWEGCLSIPGLRGAVMRSRRVRYTGVDCDGRTLAGVADGLHANIIQHEADHLDGVLFPMKLADPRLFGFAEEVGRYPLSPLSAEQPA